MFLSIFSKLKTRERTSTSPCEVLRKMERIDLPLWTRWRWRTGEMEELGFVNFSNSFPEADSASSSSSLKSKTSRFFFIATWKPRRGGKEIIQAGDRRFAIGNRKVEWERERETPKRNKSNNECYRVCTPRADVTLHYLYRLLKIIQLTKWHKYPFVFAFKFIKKVGTWTRPGRSGLRVGFGPILFGS